PGRTAGVLYAVNTFGAVVGVAVAGYILIPAIGNRATIAIAATTNVAVGLLAIAYAWSRRSSEPHMISQSPPDSTSSTTLARHAWLTVAALGISGAVSMLYEVAWTRALSLVIGSSTYAFTSVLVAFLLGIGGGSGLFAWFWGRRPASPAGCAVIQGGVGVVVALTLLVFDRMPGLFLGALQWSDSPAFVQIVQLGMSGGALVLSTLLIGGTFPCVVAVVARDPARLG